MTAFSSLAETLDATVGRHLPAIGGVLSEYDRRRETFEANTAAAKGGYDRNGTEQQVKQDYAGFMKSARERGFGCLDSLEADLDKAIADAYELDSGIMVELAPVVALDLPDGDVRRLASKYVGNRGALLVLASGDSDAASQIKLALGAVDEGVGIYRNKVHEIISDALLEQNSHRLGDLEAVLTRLCSRRVAEPMADLEAVIAGANSSWEMRTLSALEKLSRSK